MREIGWIGSTCMFMRCLNASFVYSISNSCISVAVLYLSLFFAGPGNGANRAGSISYSQFSSDPSYFWSKHSRLRRATTLCVFG
jgi:hypothetical protein